MNICMILLIIFYISDIFDDVLLFLSTFFDDNVFSLQVKFYFLRIYSKRYFMLIRYVEKS